MNNAVTSDILKSSE